MRQPRSKLDESIAKVLASHSRIQFTVRMLVWVILTIVSPTLRLAVYLKPVDPGNRSIAIVTLNVSYLALAIGSAAYAIIHFDDNLAPLRAHAWSCWWIWAWFLWSRCAEVFIAFYRDATDQLRGKPAKSDLTASWRVWLALNSYLELIIDYALIYALLPEDVWSSAPTSITQTLWISASTITTSGSAGFMLTDWLPQLLSTFEIFGGVILLVVCFALYVGGKADERLIGEAQK